MKVRATLEFDLEDESGNPLEDRHLFVLAAAHTEDAIRHRLMGNGFLPDDMVVDTWTLIVGVTDGPVGDPALPP